MDRETKLILRNNIIKFIIGLILLIISYGYIQNHPAERASIFSGFEVLLQKVEVFFYKVTKNDSKALQTKFDVEKTFEEFINTAKNNSCISANILDEINNSYVALKKESLKTLDDNLPFYERKISEYKGQIDSACKN